MSPIVTAASEIASARRRLRSNRAEQRRLRQPLELIDHLVEQCEEFNLMGQHRVPESLAPDLEHLALLADETSPEAAENLRPGVTVRRLLDQLYALREELVAALVDRRGFRDVDREIDASQPH